MEIYSVEDLIVYCTDNGRVCPQPELWNEMWKKLKEKKRNGNGWEPPLPLILAAWHISSPSSKQLRLVQHLIWADNHGQLKEIGEFIKSLTESQWVHLSD